MFNSRFRFLIQSEKIFIVFFTVQEREKKTLPAFQKITKRRRLKLINVFLTFFPQRCRWKKKKNMLYITKGAGSQKWMNNETMSPKSSPHRPTERAHNIVLICNNYLHYNELHSPCFIDDGEGEKWVEKMRNVLEESRWIRWNENWKKAVKKFCLWKRGKNVIMLKRQTSLGATKREKIVFVLWPFIPKYKTLQRK